VAAFEPFRFGRWLVIWRQGNTQQNLGDLTMAERKSVADWMRERGMEIGQLVEAAALEERVIEAIVQGRYTPSPQQRQRIAAALRIDADQIMWGHIVEVQNLYGHGPQFGRTP
jgi:hypothetical protein